MTTRCVRGRKCVWLGFAVICVHILMSATYVLWNARKPQNEGHHVNYQLGQNLPPIYPSTDICRIVISEKLNPLFRAIFMNITLARQCHVDLLDENECKKFKQIEGTEPTLSAEELEFPLAFSFNIHKEYNQFSRLFRAVYRNHNAYCIHVDAKASRDFRRNVHHLAKCFGSNVHVISEEESIDIKWGNLGTIEAWVRCAVHFLNRSRVAWKYMLNGSGQEFPLRTNWELVKALKAANGSNIVESNYPNTGKRRAPATPLSFNITWFKGSISTALRRDMVNFALTDKHATEILSALRIEGNVKKTQDEVFFATLNYDLRFKAPGGCEYTQPRNESDPRSTFVARFVEWIKRKCLTKLQIRHVCIMGLAYIPMLTKRAEFFVNKFLYDFQPLAYDCLEWWLFQKVKYEREFGETVSEFDTSYYRNLYCSQGQFSHHFTSH